MGEIQLDLFNAEVVVNNNRYFHGVLIEEIPPVDPKDAIRRVREAERLRRTSLAAVKELDEDF